MSPDLGLNEDGRNPSHGSHRQLKNTKSHNCVCQPSAPMVDHSKPLRVGTFFLLLPVTVSTATETSAFVLRTRSYGESDSIVSFITEDFGKMTGIAKGAKRSRRRFVNTLEPFVKVRVTFRARPRSDLTFLDRCDLIDTLPSFGTDLDRFAFGSYVLELTDLMVMGRESGAEVFHLVDSTLRALERDGARPAIIRGFELHMLSAAGYRPDFGRCGGCGTGVAPLESVAIIPARGRAFCPSCRPPHDRAHTVPGPTAAILAELQRNPIGATDQPDQDAPATEAALEELLAQVITRPMRSRAVLSALR